MDVIRRNTDYGLRVMANLAKNWNGRPISAKKLSEDEHISYQLTCKLMQRLHNARLVESRMGPRGGFILSRPPSQITLMEIINVLQGGIRLNRCLPGGEGCEFQHDCEVNTKLACLQLYIDGYLSGITLDELLLSRAKSEAAG